MQNFPQEDNLLCQQLESRRKGSLKKKKKKKKPLPPPVALGLNFNQVTDADLVAGRFLVIAHGTRWVEGKSATHSTLTVFYM